MSRTTTTAPGGMLRVRRTRRKRKRDMRLQAPGERRTDPLHALQTLQRPEGAQRAAVRHDPRRERGTDPGQALELRGARDVEVQDEHARRGSAGRRKGRRGSGRGPGRSPGSPARRGGRRGSARRRPPAAGCDRGVHLRDLERELRAVGRRRTRRPNRGGPTDGDSKRRDRGHEQESAMLGWRRHAEPLVRRPSRAVPVRCGPARGLPDRSQMQCAHAPRVDYCHSGVALMRLCCCVDRQKPATSRGPAEVSLRRRPRSAGSPATPCPACPPACGARGSRGRSHRSPAAPWPGAAHGHP